MLMSQMETDAQRDKGMCLNQGYTVAWSDLYKGGRRNKDLIPSTFPTPIF